jgi:superfamily II DNA or RNA helicase
MIVSVTTFLITNTCRSTNMVDGIGQIHLFNLKTYLFPIGLLADLIRWLRELEIEFVVDKHLRLTAFTDELEVWKASTLPTLELEPYDYQLDTFQKAIQLNRALILSPTASGKSFIIYLIIRFLLEHTENKILISVPSINLVRQMHTDFCEYESDGLVCDQCYEMLAGVSKTTSKRVIIATWSMLLRSDPEWFQPFDALIVDEAHQADSLALGKIISQQPHVKYRFGFTGTLDGSRSHEMQCRAWFGGLIRSSSTRELIDRGILSPLTVRCISLNYSDAERKIVQKLDYQNEIRYLVTHQQRNDWLIHLALSQKKNTLLLFNLVEDHGLKLFERAQSLASEYNKQVYLIVGDIGVDQRESIRQTMETHDNVVLFASFGTMSVGVNIKNLHNLILAHPFKAKIRTLQSIGRTLRKLTSDKHSTIIDIIDNLCIAKHQNIVYKHGLQRMKLYDSECFDTSFETQTLT